MHGAIDLASNLRLIELLGEKPLAARFRKRAVLNYVAGRLDDNNLDHFRIDAMGARQQGANLIGLRERER